MPVSSSAGWVVHKFGGSSVADSACFHRVADILESQPVGRLGVVLSACKGVTDDLLALVAKAERQDPDFVAGLAPLRDRHAAIARELLSPDAAAAWLADFDRDSSDIEGILKAVRLTRSAARNIHDVVAGYGEIWSTQLFREFYSGRTGRSGEVRWLDAREVVVVESGPLGPMVQWEA